MVQGVRDVFEIVDLDLRADSDSDQRKSTKGEGEGKLVLIGRGLDEGVFAGSLRTCLADGFSWDG